MNAYRTLTVAAALALSTLAAQAAGPQLPTTGEWSSAPLTAEAPSTLTRQAVVADLVAAREAGTMPRDGEWSNVPAPLGSASAATTLTRAEVRAEAIAAAKANMIPHGIY